MNKAWIVQYCTGSEPRLKVFKSETKMKIWLGEFLITKQKEILDKESWINSVIFGEISFIDASIQCEKNE